METKKSKIFLGSDHAGFPLKEFIKGYLESKENIEIVDCGCNSDLSVDYPIYAEAVAKEVVKDLSSRGIVFCGSGIGIGIAANKVNGIRCALVHDYLSAKLCRQHNDCNMISLGAGFVGKEVAKNIVDTFIDTSFTGEERHQRRINLMSLIEKNN